MAAMTADEMVDLRAARKEILSVAESVDCSVDPRAELTAVLMAEKSAVYSAALTVALKVASLAAYWAERSADELAERSAGDLAACWADHLVDLTDSELVQTSVARLGMLKAVTMDVTTGPSWGISLAAKTASTRADEMVHPMGEMWDTCWGSW